jgi:phosphohistidine swiveling domain-containing protein
MKVKIDKRKSSWRISAYTGVSSNFDAPRQYAEKFVKLIEIIQKGAPVFTGNEIVSWGAEEGGSAQEELAQVYSYLGVEKGQASQSSVLRLFADGKIIVNNGGVLAPSISYNPEEQIIKESLGNARDMIMQAVTLESLEPGLFDYRGEDYAGSALIKIGALKLKSGYLSVKLAQTSDISAALCELVKLDGSRTKLNDETLREILSEQGYELCPAAKVSNLDERHFTAALKTQRRKSRAKEILGVGVANGRYGMLSARASYDAASAGKGDVLITDILSYDESTDWKNVEAIIMTSGGITSHAALIADEKRKPFIALMGGASGSRIPHIGEGDEILLDASGGRILVFDKVHSVLMLDLKSALENNDVAKIKILIEGNPFPESAEQMTEYAYYYCVEREELAPALEFLRAMDKRGIIKELDASAEDALGIKETIENAKISAGNNCSGMAYSLLTNAFIRMKNASDAKLLQDGEKLKERLQKIIYLDMYFKIKKLRALSLKNKSRAGASDMALLAEETAYYNAAYGLKAAYAALEESAKSLEIYNANQKDILDLEELAYLNLAGLFGSKSVKLSYAKKRLGERFAALNIGISEGFAVSRNVFENFLNDSVLLENFKRAVENSDEKKASELAAEISEKIDLFSEEAINSLISSRLDDNGLYAVRSSGVNEDGTERSFAGMASTILNVSKKDAAACIKRVWKSFYEPRIVEYMVENAAIAVPAVFVQEMVKDQSAAGQIITRNAEGNTLIEAVWGLGQGSVSGAVTPDIAVIKNADGYAGYKKAENRKIKAVKSDGGFKYESLSAQEKANRVLSAQTVGRLHEAGAAIEFIFKYPVDIEFAVDSKGKIHILQVRPVTSFLTRADQRNSFSLDGDYKTAVLFKDFESAQEIRQELFFITDPKTHDDPIGVYFEGYDESEKTLAFAVNSKYSGYDKEKILSAITERLGDKNALEKLNENMPPFAKIRYGFFTADPAYEKTPEIGDSLNRLTLPQGANKLLCAA